MLLDGAHLVATALDAKLALHHVMVAADAATSQEITTIVTHAYARHVPVDTASASVMDAVSPVKSPSPILALAERPAADETALAHTTDGFVLVACDVQDPGNLGAIARVADAAGAMALLVTGQSADPFGWKALRGSMGSLLRLLTMRIATTEDAVAMLRRAGFRIAATSPREGRSLFAANLRGRLAILVGGEGSGLPPALVASADERLTIPMADGVESLNVAVAAALFAYEAHRQHNSV
ncbi:MAG: RNA methyltransferase [Acidobacteriaceae bacterium]|jgi:TrmH family RNA methyltransferase|nr:RNA methyltransferase [Acidobacteriaceae bacterium]